MNIPSTLFLTPILLVLFFYGGICSSEEETDASTPGIVPLPQNVSKRMGQFAIKPGTIIFVEAGHVEALKTAGYLSELLFAATGHKTKIVETEHHNDLKDGILLTTRGAEEAQGLEGYTLDISPDRVVINANSGAGLFYGVQTLRQLLPVRTESEKLKENATWTVPCMYIEDSPRYAWRGMHLDVARHFFSMEFIKKYIDLLGYYKMNSFHWHLTDDQGWRIEMKRYPTLTGEGAWRDGIGWGLDPASSRHVDEQGRYGGYYSQEDIREIVAYAGERHVTIIPEIDVPGHSMAALTAFPELSCTGEPEKVFCAGNEKSYEFLENVFAEVAELFPGQRIHIGADEVFKGLKWGDCSTCQKKMNEEGLKDTHELQSYFSRRMEKILNSLQKEMIGWDEVEDDDLSLDAMIMAWRGTKFGLNAARKGHDVVMCPADYCYFDYIQGDARFEPKGRTTRFVPLEKVYSFEPIPSGFPADAAKHIVGVQGNLWSELIPNEKQVEYMVLPRMCALAEVAWTDSQLREWTDFQQRMFSIYPRLDAMGVNYRFPGPEAERNTVLFTDEAFVTFEKDPGKELLIRYTLDGTTPDESSPIYEDGVRVTRPSEVRASYFNQNGRQSPPTIVQCIRSDSVDPKELEPGLYAHYAEGAWKTLPSLNKLSSVDVEKVSGFDLGIRQRDDDFIIYFNGYIKIDKEGVYTFTLGSDDGSKLTIGSELVVDNDGRHGYREVSGEIYTSGGIYPLSVGYLEAKGAERLKVFVEGPGLEKQMIPSAMLYRQQDRL